MSTRVRLREIILKRRGYGSGIFFPEKSAHSLVTGDHMTSNTQQFPAKSIWAGNIAK